MPVTIVKKQSSAATVYTKLQIRRACRSLGIESQLDALLASSPEFASDWADAQEIDLADPATAAAVAQSGIDVAAVIAKINETSRSLKMTSKMLIAAIITCLLLCGGCLSRTTYYEPTEATVSRGDDGKYRGAVKEEGQYPWWSDAPGKSFLNPTVSIAP